MHKGVTLKTAGTTQTCSVEGDEHLLERAVENLLDNALRYTPEGGVIEVSWRCEADRAVFAVNDTGRGIHPDDIPHLFDPLFRGETSRNRQTGDAGLGLAIARRVLLSAGGDLVAGNRETVARSLQAGFRRVLRRWPFAKLSRCPPVCPQACPPVCQRARVG